MARNDPMMRFRAPEELRAKLEAAAAESHRSLNAEIVQRLEGSFSKETSDGIDAISSELVDVYRLQKILSSNIIVHFIDSALKNNYKIDGMSPDYLMRLRGAYSNSLGTDGEMTTTLTTFSRLLGTNIRNAPNAILDLLNHYGVTHPEDSH